MSTKHRKSSMGRSRDFGTEGAGKGDSNRVTDTAAYAANFDAINWGDKPAPVPAPNPALEDFESWDR